MPLGWIKEVLGIADAVSKVVDDLHLSEEEKLRLKSQLLPKLMKLENEVLKLRAEIIQKEASSESWLTRSWRPLTMLTFTALLVADWLGFTAPNLSSELKEKLYEIIQLGIGGYVIGRSFEKTMPYLASVFRKEN